MLSADADGSRDIGDKKTFVILNSVFDVRYSIHAGLTTLEIISSNFGFALHRLLLKTKGRRLTLNMM